MIVRHKQSKESRSKNGASVKASSWRRRTRDKTNNMQCAIGAWEEDFQTPSRNRRGRTLLWEELPHPMDWD